MADTRAPRTRPSARLSLLGLAATGLLLAGCGGSSTHSSSASSSVAQTAASVAQSSSSTNVQSASSSSAAPARRHHDGAKHGATPAASGGGSSSETLSKSGKQHLRAVDVRSAKQVQRARGGADEPVTPPIKAPNPCQLVSESAAQSILGGPVVMTEAPLGPTCIIKVGQQKQLVTVAVENLQLSAQLHQMKKVERSSVAGHPTYCGKLGQSQLYLSLTGGKTLAVTAPCGAAKALAAEAISHLKA